MTLPGEASVLRTVRIGSPALTQTRARHTVPQQASGEKWGLTRIPHQTPSPGQRSDPVISCIVDARSVNLGAREVGLPERGGSERAAGRAWGVAEAAGTFRPGGPPK